MFRTAAALSTLLLLVLAGCHGFFQAPVLQSITITPATGPVSPPTTTLTATGTYDDGSTGTISSSKLTWASSDTTKATVDANGVLTGIAAGTTTITATNGAGGIQGTVSFTVTNGTLQSISVSCASSIVIASTAAGSQTDQCTATGSYSGGQTGVNISNSVTWTIISTGSGLTISNTGLVTIPAGTLAQSATINAALSPATPSSAVITTQ
jgi:uncharacterized protein YjdB